MITAWLCDSDWTPIDDTPLCELETNIATTEDWYFTFEWNVYLLYSDK